MRKSGLLLYIVVALGVLHAGEASAQFLGGTGALKLPPRPMKLGVHTDDFVLLPTFVLGMAYDTNVFYEDVSDYEEPNSSPLLKVGPGLTIINRNTRNLKVKFSGNAYVDYYLADSETVSEHSNFGGDVGIAATFFNSGQFSLTLRERFRRALERRNGQTGSNFNRHLNRVGAGAVFKPGGGALEIRTDYDFVADLFSDTTKDWGDLVYHDVRLRASWKFFPFTAVLAEGNWQVRDYLSDGHGYYGELTDNTPLKGRIGINGFITKKLSFMALVGWGHSFHAERTVDPQETAETPDANQSFNSVIGEARLSLRFSPNTILQGGYVRDFRDSLFSNFVSYHKFYGNFQQRIASRVDVELDVAYLYLTYAQLPRSYLYNAQSDAVTGLLGAGWDRTDILLVGQMKTTVDITRALGLELLYRMELNNEPFNSDAKFGVRRTEADGTTIEDYLAYNRHFILGSLVVRY